MASALLDTHVLLWILTESPRLKNIKNLKKTDKLFISPISLLEIKFLNEVGKISLDWKKLVEQLKSDERFRMDDVSLDSLCSSAFDLSWTRDPFDRLLVAHSLQKRLPLATYDRLIRENYKNIIE